MSWRGRGVNFDSNGCLVAIVDDTHITFERPVYAVSFKVARNDHSRRSVCLVPRPFARNFTLMLQSDGSLLNGNGELVPESGWESCGDAAEGDILCVTYDGRDVKFLKNGAVLKTLPFHMASDQILYAQASILNAGGRMESLACEEHQRPSVKGKGAGYHGRPSRAASGGKLGGKSSPGKGSPRQNPRKVSPKSSALSSVQIPSHWSKDAQDGLFPSQGWRLEKVSREERAALTACLQTDENFGGRDHKGTISYSKLEYRAAWRFEHPALWGKYLFAKEAIRSDLNVLSEKPNGVRVSPKLFSATRTLPASLERDVNEIYLLHGTSPEVILSIMQNGMNERFAGSSAGVVFGEGSYMADDPAKADQYLVVDPSFDKDSELHKRLFIATSQRHPGNLCYMFVCRTAMGAFAMTQNGQDIQGCPGEAVFALGGASRRELANIPGSSPPVAYHSLLVNTAAGHTRFKEFVQFHGERCYPEYLIAMTRE